MFDVPHDTWLAQNVAIKLKPLFKIYKRNGLSFIVYFGTPSLLGYRIIIELKYVLFSQ